MGGLYKIGAGGNFPTLTAALDTLRAKGVSSAIILELKANYTSAGESFPINFGGIPCIDNIKTLTLRPEAGAGLLQINTAGVSSAINLTNARYITIDGRAGGIGSTRSLTIKNISFPAVIFSNDASYNNLRFLNISGDGIHMNGSTQNVTNGNIENTIEYCSISSSISIGNTGFKSQGTIGKKNRNNRLLNNHIYNYRKGIFLAANNENWEIRENQLFNELTVNSNYTGIEIYDSTSGGFQIKQNVIGGSAINAGGSDNKYTSFVGIDMITSKNVFSSIQGNTIRNFKATSDYLNAPIAGILLTSGKFKCGDEVGNVIGNSSFPRTITIEANNTFNFYGIGIGNGHVFGTSGVDTCIIENNRIAGIRAYYGPSFYLDNGLVAGIYLAEQNSGHAEIRNNMIGDPAAYLSIWNSIFSSSIKTYGIYLNQDNQTYLPENIISGNTIANLGWGATGIYQHRGKSRIMGNKIHNLYGYENLGNILTDGSIGIRISLSNPGTLVAGNTIHTLRYTGQSAEIFGILSQRNELLTIEKNFIHDLWVNTTSSADVYGIFSHDSDRKLRIRNNMIRLGLDSSGVSVLNYHTFYGISLRPDSTDILHNSVYIAGTGYLESAALYFREQTIAGNSRVMNNILVNRRSVVGSSPFYHYALKFQGGLFHTNQFNHNIYYAEGNQAFLAYLLPAPNQPQNNKFKTIIDWRNISRQDSNSIHYYPNFVKPDLDFTQVDLHLANPNPAEGQGVADPQVTEDFDGEMRNTLGPVDIGADAGNFSYQDGDAPRITHQTFFGNPLPTNYIYKVRITDNGSGVDTSGSNKPRMWFRKKYPTVGSWSSLPGELISGSTKNGIWGFVPDFAGAGVTVFAGDSLQYYFTAQDLGPVINVGYSNVTGTAHNSVLQQVTPPLVPLSLIIYGLFPDTVYVGNGQTFTSLTNDNGFFHRSKSYQFDSSAQRLTVVITSDLTETGKHTFNNFYFNGAMIRFITLTPVVKKIHSEGYQTYGVIMMDSVNNVEIDGRVDGSGRYLHFISGNANPIFTRDALSIHNGNKTFVVRNLILESNGTSVGGTLGIYNAQFDSLLVENCIFQDIQSSSTAAIGLPNTHLYFVAGNIGKKAIIRQNYFTNFGQRGIQVLYGYPNSHIYPLIIDSNHFYHNSPAIPNNFRTVIDVDTDLRCVISHNYIGGSQPYCGGSPWTFPNQPAVANTSFTAIKFLGPNYHLSSIQGNRVQNIRITNFGLAFFGIYAQRGTLDIGTVEGNLIGNLDSDSSLVNRNRFGGIYVSYASFTADTPIVRIWNNIIAGITSCTLEGIYFYANRGSIENNTVERLTGFSSFTTSLGIYGVNSTLEKGTIAGNRVQKIRTMSTTENGVECGFYIRSTGFGQNRVQVSRNQVNRISSIWNGLYQQKYTYGIQVDGEQLELINNQVSLDNGGLATTVNLRGIQVNGYSSIVNHSYFYYNTVHIGGVGTNNNNSYAFFTNNGNPILHFKNNLFYNERIGGTGKHLAVGNLSGSSTQQALPPGSLNNNLYIVQDTNFVNEFYPSGPVPMSTWRQLSQGDSASYTALVANIPLDSLFVDVNNGDLHINSIRSQSWYVNGKGLPVASISGDIDQSTGQRSTLISTGATDIGADEFNTLTDPPVLIVSGSHTPGGTEYFILNNRVMAEITWGSTGNLPTLGNPRYYSGEWPNDTSNNGQAYFARYMNGYWKIPATGGSNYNYGVIFYYDSSMLGKVLDAATMVVNKRQTGTPGTWAVVTPTSVNTTSQSITIINQNSFSEFTTSDANATLVSGVPTPDLLITGASTSGTPATGTSFTVNWTEFNQGNANAGPHQVKFLLLPVGTGSLLLDSLMISTAIAPNNSSGPLTHSIALPCTLSPGNYTLQIVVDTENNVLEKDETNNHVFLNLPISIGIPIPSTPVINASPGTSVCTPGTITLTANSANCSGCSYIWNTGTTGNSLLVTTTGAYKVTVSNSCGQATDSMAVTIHPLPNVNIIRGDTTICAGSSISLEATGASSYQWSPAEGLSATNLGNIIATPAITTTYTVTGTSAAGCVATDQINISILAAVTPSVSINYTGCPSNSLQFTATPIQGGANPSYAWLVNNNPAGTGPTFNLNNASNGMSVTVNMSSNAVCASPVMVSDSKTVNCIITAIPHIDGMEEFVVSPNPSTGEFNLRMKFSQTRKVSYELYDLQGRLLFQQPTLTLFDRQTRTINLQNHRAGIYLLYVTVGMERFAVKLIKY